MKPQEVFSMEYWIFQPQPDITTLELANLVSKFTRIPHDWKCQKINNLLGVTDVEYDAMPKEYKRHFVAYIQENLFKSYMP
jgi:hypothetical protein